MEFYHFKEHSTYNRSTRTYSTQTQTNEHWHIHRKVDENLQKKEFLFFLSSYYTVNQRMILFQSNLKLLKIHFFRSLSLSVFLIRKMRE